ncbi:HesA/MoeB/ThiF family protein [Rhizosphaericola mali]|uniref:HesA/MoeB/ThiF family protein n=1 Tax=Rhizosphaericola mali TaxID=2545455 RepID=UPI00210564A4|nr:ThiF family adenylyltransferase [Rhizosphaericola mali]
MGRYDYVIDGTDNFSSRYLINDACALLGKPLLYGAVSQYEGQLAVFNVADKKGMRTIYRDVFPKPPREGEIRNCAEAGVLGVLPGIVGTIQAAEVIKLVTGIGKPLVNQLLTYNVLSQETYTLELTKEPSTRQLMPVTPQAFMSRQ